MRWWRSLDTSLTTLASWLRSMKNIFNQRASTVFIFSVGSFRRVMATALLQVSVHTDLSLCNKYIFFTAIVFYPNQKAPKPSFKSSIIKWLDVLNKRCSDITQTDTTQSATTQKDRTQTQPIPDFISPRQDITQTVIFSYWKYFFAKLNTNFNFCFFLTHTHPSTTQQDM